MTYQIKTSGDAVPIENRIDVPESEFTQLSKTLGINEFGNPAVISNIGSVKYGPNKHSWVSGTTYNKNDIVTHSGIAYIANKTHTSETTFDPTKFLAVDSLYESTMMELMLTNLRTIKTVESISELLDLPGTTDYLVYVKGYLTVNDGGQGLFRFNSSRIAENDSGTIFFGWERIIKNNTISPEMFGARCDGITDDSVPFMAALTAAGSGTVEISGRINLPYGAVKPASFICPSIRSVSGATIIIGSSPLSIDGGSGVLCGAIWENIKFEGDGANTLIQVAGQGGITFVNCAFASAAIGILLHNRDSGMFTEYVIAEKCRFETTCLNAMTYRVTNGNNSFHGSGMRYCEINTPSSDTAHSITIEAGCLVYNAPLSVQIWAHADATLIYSAATLPRNSFYGTITTERFSGTLTIARASTAYPVYFAGFINIMNENVVLGDIILCDSVALLSNGSIQTRGGRWAKSFELHAGNTTLGPVPYGVGGWCSLCAISILGDNYDYRYILSVFNGGVATSVVAIVATLRTFNAAGYGPPTFSVDASGQIVVSNAAYPPSGVRAVIELTQLAQTNNDVRILA